MIRPSISAVILAGGKGERLGGVVKAGLMVGGVPLLTRVTAALRGVDGTLLVASGPISGGLLPLTAEHVSVADPPGWSGGPLAGIAAAAGLFDANFLLSAAVDTPFFPLDFAIRAKAAIGGADVAVARYEGQPYFTNALWTYGAMERLRRGDPGAMSAGGIKGFVRDLKVAWVDWPEGVEGDPFANVNTPEDLIALERRAARFGVGKARQNG